MYKLSETYMEKISRINKILKRGEATKTYYTTEHTYELQTSGERLIDSLHINHHIRPMFVSGEVDTLTSLHAISHSTSCKLE